MHTRAHAHAAHTHREWVGWSIMVLWRRSVSRYDPTGMVLGFSFCLGKPLQREPRIADQTPMDVCTTKSCIRVSCQSLGTRPPLVTHGGFLAAASSSERQRAEAVSSSGKQRAARSELAAAAGNSEQQASSSSGTQRACSVFFSTAPFSPSLLPLVGRIVDRT
jgi:hypothetical protein